MIYNTAKLSLVASCFISAVKNRQMFNTYRIFSEWLGAYVYVLPADRAVNKELVEHLFIYLFSHRSPKDTAFLLNIYTDILSANIPSANQLELLTYYRNLNNGRAKTTTETSA